MRPREAIFSFGPGRSGLAWLKLPPIRGLPGLDAVVAGPSEDAGAY